MTTARAQASFVIDGWEENVVLDDGIKLVRTAIEKTFAGDIVGTSVAQMIMAHAAADSMAYCGFERITATIGDRAGSFVLHHNATRAPSGGVASWTVLASSGTGALAGIRGTGVIERHEDGRHTFTLDYELA